MKHWSTSGLPASEQFESWHQVICNSFVPLRTERQKDGQSVKNGREHGFRSTLTSRESDDVFFGEVSGQAQWVYRDSQSINACDRPYYFLNIQRSGHAILEQTDKQTELSADSFAILDATLPFRMQVSDQFEQLSIKIPKARLAPLLEQPAQALAQRIDARKGFGKIVADTLTTLAQEVEQLDPMSAHLVIDQALKIVAHALNPMDINDSMFRPSSQQRRLQLIRQQAMAYLDQHIDNPEISVQDVAEKLGMSTRYIQVAFADKQDSLGHWLLNRRLQRCHAELTGPSATHQAITSLAFRYGFNDLSYFNRAFKRRFGKTPRQCRAL